MAFSDNLASLPLVDHLSGIELLHDGEIVAIIENRPGSAGSLRVYAWLAERYGEIGREAAAEGLRLYAEHTGDARSHPGKHPNIDRLLEIAAGSPPLTPRLRPA